MIENYTEEVKKVVSKLCFHCLLILLFFFLSNLAGNLDLSRKCK